MKPTESAALAAASLLARGRLTSSGQPAVPELDALIDAGLPHHSGLQEVLQQARAQPEDPARVGALAQALAALGKADLAFGRELVALVAHARQAPGVGGLVTQVYGHAQVGTLVTIGQGGDIHLHVPPVPAPTVLDQLPTARQGEAISNLPARNRAFTGRTDLLNRLHQQLTVATTDAVAVTALPTELPATVAADADAPPQVLHGLGGVGKTQLALEYAHRHAADYPIRWWVTAELPAAIPSQLATLARRLGIPQQPDEVETVAVLLGKLGRRGGWLLLFDNAEDPHDLRSYWPSTEAGGRVLVTSRNPNWQPLATLLPVDVLPREDAIAFLQRRVGLDKADADQLAHALGDLPLALEQAAAYLQQTHTPPGAYLKLLASRARELFALGRPVTSEQTIATVWRVSLQRLHTQAPAAQDLLSLCALLAPDDIPHWLLKDHVDALPEPLATVVGDPLTYGQALGALGRYSLATITDEAISVHRLVQTVVRHALDGDQATTWAAAAVALVAAAFPDQADDADTWPVATRLLPHALIFSDARVLNAPDSAATAHLLHRVTDYLWGRGEYAQAKLLAERALAICEQRLGADHPDTAQSLNNLASVLHDQDDLQGARPLYERALAIREARLGRDHPVTAQSLNNLATVLHDQGDLAAARTLHERALSIRQSHLGTDHPTTARSLNNLGLVLADQGNLDGARALLERALQVREARLGKDHPDTATSLSDLAGVLADQGNLAAARRLHERALHIRETRLGAEHPSTVRSRQNLAAVMAALDKQQ